jgi:hypothetical protein
MDDHKMSLSFPRLIVFGFIAGFLATLTFHQLTLEVLWQSGYAPFAPYVMTPTPPFGIPAVFSLSLWGGVWGILFALTQITFPRKNGYWLRSFLFGAILPSIFALLVVLPLKGKPLAGGWHTPLLITAFLINGAWGIGTGLMLRLLSNIPPQRHKPRSSGGHGHVDAGKPLAP